jgi:hypothetical protein
MMIFNYLYDYLGFTYYVEWCAFTFEPILVYRQLIDFVRH